MHECTPQKMSLGKGLETDIEGPGMLGKGFAFPLLNRGMTGSE